MKLDELNEKFKQIKNKTDFDKEDSIIRKKAFQTTLNLIDGNIRNLRYMESALAGIYGSFYNFNIPQNEATCQAMKDAIISFIEECQNGGGVEVEFASEEAYDFWQNLNHSSFIIKEHEKLDYCNNKKIYRETKLNKDIKIPQPIFA